MSQDSHSQQTVNACMCFISSQTRILFERKGWMSTSERNRFLVGTDGSR